MVSLDQTPIDAQHDLACPPGAAAPGDELFDKAPRPAGGVGRAFAHAGVEHLAVSARVASSGW